MSTSRWTTSIVMCTTSITGTRTSSSGTARNLMSTSIGTRGSRTGTRTTPTSITSTTSVSAEAALALGRERLQAAELRSRLHTALGEPSLGHLQGEHRPRRGAVRLLAVRLHVGDVDDGAARVDERDRQRDQGVLHPHAVDLRLVEDEQHPGVGAERLAVHQALHAGGVVGGDFGAD